MDKGMRASVASIKGSVYKLRPYATMIRNMNIALAMRILALHKHNPRGVAVYKVLRSAIVNAESHCDSGRINLDDIYISEVNIGAGKCMKRIRPHSKGRTGRIKKRSSFMSIVLGYRIN